MGAIANGSGYADHVLQGFSTFTANDTVKLRFKFDNASDGAENVFLIANPGTNTPVAEPASMLLLGTGLLVAARARRRKTN